MNDREDPKQSQPSAKDSAPSPKEASGEGSSVPKKITFDDFQIQKTLAQQQVDEEKRAWQERQRRLDEQKKGFLQQVVPRLRSIKEDMIGGKKKKRGGLFGGREASEGESANESSPTLPITPKPYYAEVEQLNIRVAKANRTAEEKAKESATTNRAATPRAASAAPPTTPRPAPAPPRTTSPVRIAPLPAPQERKESLWDIVQQTRPDDTPGQAPAPDVLPSDNASAYDYVESGESEDHQEGPLTYQEAQDEELPFDDGESYPLPDEQYDEPLTEEPAEAKEIEDSELENSENEDSVIEEEYAEEDYYEAQEIAAIDRHDEAPSPAAAPPTLAIPPTSAAIESAIGTTDFPREEAGWLGDEPEIHSSFKVYLDALRAFDSTPRRSSESRDPRVDFVTILSEALEILKEHVGALSAIFFWVNNKKNELVLECAALDDIAHQYISKDRKIAIDLDAVSVAVTRKKPELHSTISPQAELDLVPYYTDAIGIRSLAIMPVIFGESLVGVLTVDSLDEEQFSAETLRILTDHSRLVSGLIRSYVEKYDLLASARTLEAARKLHQIVSPDSSARAVRDQRKNPDWIFRALMEAAGDIVDWEWLATVGFDDMRRIWTLSNVQSRHAKQYLLPQTPISMTESIVGKCLQNGKSISFDSLTQQHIRFSVEEHRSMSAGHSFLAIPIRTSNKNYGVLAIEHPERHRFSESDLETLEHLARSAAAALEVTALSEIVSERALTDLLTGVLNKRGMLQRLNEELSRAMEFDEPLTLVIFEIDGAADFFSRFSQEDVDTIVLSVTRLLKFGARTFDVISRIGDHRFAALLVKMPDEEGFLWSEKMRKMIVGEVIAIGRRSFSVTISAGVSGARREGSVDELIEGAELAVERAKELGGNNVIVY